MSIVSFSDYELPPRYDGTVWTIAEISESANKTGPWTVIDTITLPVDPDPRNPEPKSFTTELATLNAGWYLVKFKDNDTNTLITDPVFNAPPASYEILASLDDINAHLDGQVIEADAQNSSLVQVSINRVIKGYLARVIDPTIMVTWATPDTTPSIVREIASMLIAAQVYFNEVARSSLIVPTDHYAQILYNQAIAMLNCIIEGEIPIPDVPMTPIESLTTLDFFPIDATDRAFTMGMNL